MTARLSRASSEDVTVTVSAAPVAPAVAGDFSVPPGSIVSVVPVLLDAPDKSVDVTATVAGGNGVATPAKQTLTIRDDEALPVVALVLDHVSIDENGGVSTVTATLSGPSSAQVTATVSATADAPATEADFTQAGTTLTLTAGQTESTGTVTMDKPEQDRRGDGDGDG